MLLFDVGLLNVKECINNLLKFFMFELYTF